MSKKRKWKIAGHNGGLTYPDYSYENHPELETWLRVVYQESEGYTEFAVAAGDAARLARLLNKLDGHHEEATK